MEYLMKHTFYIKCPFLLSIIFIILIIFTNNCYSNQEMKTYKDSHFYFSVLIPANWNIEQTKDDSSLLRIKSFSPDKMSLFSIYSIHSKDGDIELNKLGNIEKKLFNNLGHLVKENKQDKKIEKIYQSNQILNNFVFRTESCFGYILMYKTLSNDVTIFKEIENSFNSNVPFLQKVKGRIRLILSGLGGWIIGVIGILLLYPLGKTGQLVTRGFELKSALDELKLKAEKNGNTVNEKWYKIRKKAKLWIILPILGWSTIYIVLFIILPFKTFLLTLIGLIPPLLGLMGIFFVPSDDPADWTPDFE